MPLEKRYHKLFEFSIVYDIALGSRKKNIKNIIIKTPWVQEIKKGYSKESIVKKNVTKSEVKLSGS